MLKASIIIPTYNRPDDLSGCIRSVLDQTIKPYEIIVVDDGNLSELPLEKECRNMGIRYVYYKKDKPGLTESRNAGIKLAKGDIILFLDDDTVLFKDFLAEILSIYQTDTEGVVGGVGGKVVNSRALKCKDLFRRVFEINFLISGFKEGKILPSGFYTSYGLTGSPVKIVQEVDFLSGCAMSFRSEIFDEFSFANKYRDYGFGEDKDFSYSVSRRYKLIMNPGARLLHCLSGSMRHDKASEHKMFIMGRYMFFKRHMKKGRLDWFLFYYAVFGCFLFSMLALLIHPDKKRLQQLKGYSYAIRDIIRGKTLLPEEENSDK